MEEEKNADIKLALIKAFKQACFEAERDNLPFQRPQNNLD